MERARLGSSDLFVSPLALGTMEFGRGTPETEAARLVDTCRQAGMNVVDVGDAYAGGEAERVVGRLLRKTRDEWVIITKVGTLPEERQGAGLSREWMLQAIDASLQRLATERIDVWCLHHEDALTPLEETITAIGEVIRAGKIRHWGFSNFHAWKIAELIRLSDALGVARPVMAQPFYNLLNRMAERDYIPACRHFGIGVMAYSPLARGVLTGKYSLDRPPADDTRAARGNRRMLEVDYRPQSIAIAADLQQTLTARGTSLPSFAVQWLLQNEALCSVVAGPRTLQQLDPYLDGVSLPWHAGDEALVDRLVPPGHPSTPGFTDPKYPVAGRFPRIAR